MKTHLPQSFFLGTSKLWLLFALILWISTPSCSKYEELLPNQLVQLTVNLNDARYNNLNYIGGFHEFKWGDPSLPLGTALGNGGILLVYSITPLDPSEPYAAYDLYCTNEKNVVVETQPGGLKAICPKCKSEYDITSGFGICTSGPNQGNHLEIYKATRVGQSIRVTRK